MISPLGGATEEEPSTLAAAGLCTAAGAGEAAATKGRAVGKLKLAPAAAAERVGPWRTRGLKE